MVVSGVLGSWAIAYMHDQLIALSRPALLPGIRHENLKAAAEETSGLQAWTETEAKKRKHKLAILAVINVSEKQEGRTFCAA